MVELYQLLSVPFSRGEHIFTIVFSIFLAPAAVSCNDTHFFRVLFF